MIEDINTFDLIKLLNERKNGEKEFIVIFHTPFSAPCQKLLQTIKKNSDWLQHVPIYLIDVDKPRGENEIIPIQIPCIPAILFKSPGKPRITVGALSIEQLSQLIKEELRYRIPGYFY